MCRLSYRICELLFEGRGEYDRAAGCMLHHGAGRATVHQFLAERAAAERKAPVQPPRDAASIARSHLQVREMEGELCSRRGGADGDGRDAVIIRPLF